jgi:hypothetical protein
MGGGIQKGNGKFSYGNKIGTYSHWEIEENSRRKYEQ